MRKIIPLDGKVIGNLTVLHMVRIKHESAIFWQVRCDCGREYPVNGVHLRNEAIKMCMACSRRTSKYSNSYRTTHPSEFRTWERLKRHYSADPTQICERWSTFNNFIEDMGKRPARMRLIRLSHAKPYEPGNVIWHRK